MQLNPATLIAEMLPEVGIGIDFQTTDWDTFWELVYYPDGGCLRDCIKQRKNLRPLRTPTGFGAEASSWDELGEELEFLLLR